MSHPLYKQIQMDIRQKIRFGELAPGALVPSEKDLAHQYGVSQITSKNALNGLVEEGLLERHRGKGTFVRTEAGNGTRKHRSVGDGSTIALILPTMKTKVDQRLLDALEKYGAQAQLELFIRITRESREEESLAIERFRNRGVDGFIIFPVEQENYNDAILRLSLDRFPLVLVDRFLKEIRTYSVSSDNFGGAREAISDLLEEGHRRIAYLSTEITNTVTEERARGYEAAFTDRELPIDKSYWCLLPIDTIASGKAEEAITRFLGERPETTAVFAANAELARDAERAIRALWDGRPAHAMPKLTAFDDPNVRGATYIQQQEDEIGRVAVQLLAEQLAGRFEPRRVVVPVLYPRSAD